MREKGVTTISTYARGGSRIADHRSRMADRASFAIQRESRPQHTQNMFVVWKRYRGGVEYHQLARRMGWIAARC